MRQGFHSDITTIPGIQAYPNTAISSHTTLGNRPSCGLSDIGRNLAKRVLFACSLCDGPLVASSFCIVCKKTASRRCAHCNSTSNVGLHDSCKNLVVIRNEISTQSKIKPKEKNN